MNDYAKIILIMAILGGLFAIFFRIFVIGG